MPKNTPANKTSVMGLFVSHAYTPGDSSLMRVVVMRAHMLKRAPQGNQDRMRSWLGRAHPAELLHVSRCEGKVVISTLLITTLLDRPAVDVVYIFVLCNEEPLCKSNTTINRFGYMFDFCSHYWECLLAQQNQGELICLLRPRKHLRVAVKYT